MSQRGWRRRKKLRRKIGARHAKRVAARVALKLKPPRKLTAEWTANFIRQTQFVSGLGGGKSNGLMRSEDWPSE